MTLSSYRAIEQRILPEQSLIIRGLCHVTSGGFEYIQRGSVLNAVTDASSDRWFNLSEAFNSVKRLGLSSLGDTNRGWVSILSPDNHASLVRGNPNPGRDSG